MANVLHLARRWLSSLSRAEPAEVEVEWAASFLGEGEFAIWCDMMQVDRRHSLVVARRFVDMKMDATRDEVAAALLHDVGKRASSLGVTQRVLATLFGPRTGRWQSYHDHERIGIEMCREAGSSPITIAILADPDHPTAAVLRRADDI